MSDLNSALRSALDGWNSDDKQTTEPTTMTNSTITRPPITVSKRTFNYVKDHPYTTKVEAIAALAKEGYNTASTLSLISHMIRQRLVSSDANGKLTAIVKAYIPLKATPKIIGRKPTVQPPRMEHKQVRITVRGEDLAPRSGGIPMLVKPALAANIKTLLDEISVNEARALYLELKSMFGGN